MPEESPRPAPAGAPTRPGSVLAVAAASCGAAIALLVGVLGYTRLWYGFHDVSDTSLYHAYARELARGARPYVDFFLEYPPLAAGVLRLVPFTPDAPAWIHRFNALMLAACGGAALLTGAAAARLWPAGRRAHAAAAAFGGGVLAIGAIVANRLDGAVALCLAAALWLLAARRWTLAAAAIGAAFGLKLVPAVLLPLVLLLAPRAADRARAAAAFAVTAALPVLPHLGAPGLAAFLRYHLARPLQIESVLASPLLALRLAGLAPGTAGKEYGSHFLAAPGASALAAASGPLALAAVAATYALLWRRRERLRGDPTLVPAAVLAVLLSTLAFGKVLSPQYLVWLLPCVALVLPRAPAAGAAGLAVLAATHLEFPALYWRLVALDPLPVAIVIVRNALLVATLVLALRALAGHAPAPPLPGDAAAR
jgi:hypothetical protein